MNGNLADAVSFVREDVQKMKAYAPGEQITGCIKLNTNECAWGPAPAVLKAVCAVTEDQLRLYPSPMSDKVRKAASEVFGVQPAQVLVGNGSDDCLTIIMRTFSQPGDTVACAWPTYSLYDTLASIQGVGIQHVDWLAQPDPVLGQADGVPGWHLPITGLLQTGARVVFIANPNNPSATRVPLPALEYLASHLKGILVVDEAYIDYALDGDGMAASFLGKLDAYPNVLVLRTFSKSYSMAGARLGLMFAHAELIDHMNKVKDSYNVNALTQLAGEAALLDRAYFSWLVGETIKQRKVRARRSSRLALWPASAFSPSSSPWLIACPFSPSLAPTSSPAPIPSPPPSPGLHPPQPSALPRPPSPPAALPLTTSPGSRGGVQRLRLDVADLRRQLCADGGRLGRQGGRAVRALQRGRRAGPLLGLAPRARHEAARHGRHQGVGRQIRGDCDPGAALAGGHVRERRRRTHRAHGPMPFACWAHDDTRRDGPDAYNAVPY